MRQVFFGIDPGKDGALAYVFENTATAVHMPLMASGTVSSRSGADQFEVDPCAVQLWFRQVIQQLRAEMATVTIEKVGAMPGQGVVSMFNFGCTFGALKAAIRTYNFDGQRLGMELPAPQTWKKVMLADTAKDKTAAIAFVQRMYPGTSLLPTERSKKPHDGMAEAICLAEYGRRLAYGATTR